MDSENEKLRKALATLLRVVQKRSCDIVDVVKSAFQPFNSPLVDELNRALVEIDDLAKDLEDVAVQTQWEVENMANCQVNDNRRQEEAVEELLIEDGSEDELLIDEESPINYEDLVGYANPTHSNTVDVDAEESVPSSFTSKRPLGRDSSKEKAKRTKSVDTSSSDSEFMTRMGDLSLERLSVYKTVVTTEEKKLDSMNKNERQKLLLEKKKLNLEKLRLERQKLKEDKEEEIMILSMDLSKCNPLLRQYYEAKQQEILARVTGSTSSGQ